MRFIAFFFKGFGVIVTLALAGWFVAYLIHRSQLKSQAHQDKTHPTHEVGKSDPTTAVDTTVVSKVSDLTDTQLSPIHNESEPTKTKPIFNQVQQRPPLPTLVSFYTAT